MKAVVATQRWALARVPGLASAADEYTSFALQKITWKIFCRTLVIVLVMFSIRKCTCLLLDGPPTLDFMCL